MTLPRVNFREPRTLVRAALGALLLANLAVAVWAFHLIGDTPADLESQLATARGNLRTAQTRLNRSRLLAAHMDLGKEEGDRFLASYMTSRRRTYSTILDEINRLAAASGMKIGDENFAVPDPIEGSEDLDMLTITAHFEGGYPQLMKFVNLVDRSPRFLVIEVLQVAPQPRGDVLDVTIKLNTFLKDDREGTL